MRRIEKGRERAYCGLWLGWSLRWLLCDYRVFLLSCGVDPNSDFPFPRRTLELALADRYAGPGVRRGLRDREWIDCREGELEKLGGMCSWGAKKLIDALEEAYRRRVVDDKLLCPEEEGDSGDSGAGE